MFFRDPHAPQPLQQERVRKEGEKWLGRAAASSLYSVTGSLVQIVFGNPAAAAP